MLVPRGLEGSWWPMCSWWIRVLVLDPVHPDKTTMMIATTKDRLNAEPVVAIIAHPSLHVRSVMSGDEPSKPPSVQGDVGYF